MFLDRAEVEVYGGTGGSGAEAWRRETGVARGGPAGGDGGKGGDVVLVADEHMATLLDYRYRQHHRAERGKHGEGSNRTGRSGADLELAVPRGTVVREAGSGVLLGELMAVGDRLVVARGGRGGRGNAAFATPTNRAPRRWEPGEEGEERRIAFELKLIADVGLVGLPNAGKSTFLAAVSQARPKIADYPFTTLQPNLGVVARSEGRTMVIADIPGIIEGAHEGKGLGLRFLRHIERTRALAILVPVDSADASDEYRLLLRELEAHSPELAGKPHCVVLTKSDLLGPDDDPPSIDAPGAWAIHVVSAVTGAGLDPLLEGLWTRVAQERSVESAPLKEEPWHP
ncbi:MAG: GTPase ObgE [Gemmatimonadota bacterium]